MTERRDKRAVKAWMERWGFAVLVGTAAVLGFVVGATVTVPGEIPAVALQAEPVYRLEVGGVLFAGLYMVAMSFALALRNRGFTEISTGGLTAHDLGRMPEAVVADRRLFDELAAAITEIRGGARDGNG